MILIRVFLLALVVLILNSVYNLSFYHKDLRQHYQQAIDIKETQGETDIFYFAESSNVDVQKTDSIQYSISEITNLFFPSLKITAINKPATHAGMYKQWLRQMEPGTKKPKAVVITLNLRSFDAAWIHSKLETQLQQSLVLDKPYPHIVDRFLLSLGAFDNKTDEQRENDMLEDWRGTLLKFPFPFKYQTVKEWDNAIAQGGFLKNDGSWDNEKIELACHYVKAYAFNLSDENPRIKDFDAITDWCRTNKLPVYLNLLAENIEYADSLVGKELVFLMRQNRDFLVKRYARANCIVVDNLELVGGKEFTDQRWTTEHYGYKGRMIIAKHLAEELKDQFSNAYKKAY